MSFYYRVEIYIIKYYVINIKLHLSIVFCTFFLFLGGATAQFAAIPMNLLGVALIADYIVTGVWSQKAAQEVNHPSHIVWGGATARFTRVYYNI